MKHDAPAQVTDEIIEAVAEEAEAHQRTVERRLLRLPVKGRVGKRVDAVLERRGLVNDGGSR